MWTWLFICVFKLEVGLSVFTTLFLVWPLTLFHRGFGFGLAHCTLCFLLIELFWSLVHPYLWLGFVHFTTISKHPLFGKKNSLKTNTNTLLHHYLIFILLNCKNLTFGGFSKWLLLAEGYHQRGLHDGVHPSKPRSCLRFLLQWLYGVWLLQSHWDATSVFG